MKKRYIVILLSALLLQGCNKQEITLFQAVEAKDTQKVLTLLKDDIPINAQDAKGRTSLMIATHNNDYDMAKLLIDNGADVNIQDKQQDNPFLYAGAEGYLEILKLTIDAGADPTLTNRYGGTPLIPASEHGHVEVVKELLTRTKVDVNHINNLGWTALMEAIVLNSGGPRQQEVISLLITHGADVNIPDKDGITPLQHAKEKGFTEIEQILLQAGAK
ncbi:ankyrin repeat domain-containing protein [Priestia taiwanensis]|nr:ankyrin repeat domain-containing protein [Priestia taiwanensis]